ncbi:MAG: TolB family protein [Gammaproteobacteria bacterium]
MKPTLAACLLMPGLASAQAAIEATPIEQLTGLENTYPAWSPDGSGVVQLTRNQVADSTPVFTPDGNLDIFRMRTDGSEPLKLSRHPGADGHPKISADGRRIWFNSNRSSDPATFARGVMDREHNHEIHSMTLDGGDVRRHTDLQDCDTYPAISSDGRLLHWRRVTPSGGHTGSGRNSEVFWMDLASGAMRNVTAHQAFDGWPAWSPDGQRSAFASNRASAGFEAFDICVANVDGSNPARVTFGDGEAGNGSYTKPSFSADGKRILCTRSVGNSVDILVLTLR